jgi:acyl-CoA synthetase (AMP-forming)/AMP-acid ligase II
VGELSQVVADTSSPVRETTIASILEEAAGASPSRTALVVGVPDASERRRSTFAELERDASTAAGFLAERYAPGERLGVYAPSLAESLILSFAAAKARLVLVPFNPLLRSGEVAHILGSAGAAGVFTVGAYRDHRPADVLAGLRGELPRLREVHRFEDWEQLLAGARVSAPGTGPDPDDVAQIIFTSGTTGAPKGAELTHRAMTNAARFGVERFDVRAGDVYVNPMPLFHVGGQAVAFGLCCQHATNVLVPGFEPGLVLELVEVERATQTVGVPTMLVAMIDHPDFARRDLSSLRAVSSGGAVVPPEMVRHIESTLAARMTVVFGQTEASGFISQTELDDDPEVKALTLGHPLPHVDARVVDPASGAVVPLGEVGELQIRGPNVMRGYHGLPDQTAQAIVDGGWLRTGDLVTMDERGYLRIAGRLKEMIVSGGVNVFPVEVEAVLDAHPDVERSAVVGVPDRRWGEMVVGVLKPARDTLDPADVEAWTRERLAPFKVPKRFVVVDELPQTAMGKVQKFLLREQLS